MRVFFAFCCFAALSALCAATKMYSHLTDADGEDIYIRHHDALRWKRSAESNDVGIDQESGEMTAFPEQMTFSFIYKRQKVMLELLLNTIQKSHVPMKLVTKDGVSAYRNEAKRDYAFYQILNDDIGASVMVKCPNFRFPCHIVGNIHFGGQEYVVEPGSNDLILLTKGSKIAHKLYRVQEQKKADLTRDTVKKVIDLKKNGDRHNRTDDSTGDRARRQATTVSHTIEVEMVVDLSIYQFWMERTGVQAALGVIQQYYEQVANNMNLRFSSASSDSMTIDIVPLEITIITESAGQPWINRNTLYTEGGNEYLDDQGALAGFNSWVGENVNSLSDFDAIMTFTMKDLSFGGRAGAGIIGLSYTYVDGTKPIVASCRKSQGNFSVSIVEQGNDVSLTATHELAHTLGVAHDTEYPACNVSPAQYYIMAPSRTVVGITAAASSHPWTFSTCSISAMESYLNDMVNLGLDCLQTSSFEVNAYETLQASKLLGEIYTLDQQCELNVGTGSTVCNVNLQGYSLDNLCYQGIYCLKPGTTNCTSLNVMSGSMCPTGQCYEGNCVSSIPRPTMTTTNTTTTTRPTTPSTEEPTSSAPTLSPGIVSLLYVFLVMRVTIS